MEKRQRVEHRGIHKDKKAIGWENERGCFSQVFTIRGAQRLEFWRLGGLDWYRNPRVLPYSWKECGQATPGKVALSEDCLRCTGGDCSLFEHL